MVPLENSITDLEESIMNLETITKLFWLVNNTVESEMLDFMVKQLQNEVDALRVLHTNISHQSEVPA